MSAFKRWLWVFMAWFGIPGDFHWWWTVGFPLVGAAVIDTVLVFVREAPLRELILVFIIVCIVFFLGASWWRKPRVSAIPTNSSGSTYNIENVYVGAQSEEQSELATQEEELKHKCRRLGAKLNELLDQWRTKREKIEARRPTDKLQRQLKAQELDMVTKWAHKEYKGEFRAQAMKLFEQAWEYGLLDDPAWKWRAKSAGHSELGMEMVAKRLMDIGSEE